MPRRNKPRRPTVPVVTATRAGSDAEPTWVVEREGRGAKRTLATTPDAVEAAHVMLDTLRTKKTKPKP